MNKNSLLSDNYFDKIEPYLYEIMDSETAHTVRSLSMELRTEYPEEFLAFNTKFSADYALKGCGQRHAHVNGLTIVLENLLQKNKVEKSMRDGEVVWRRID
ncbi:MAG: hypothetical protein U0M15_03700 [Bacillota bacterium]|nr:hypothetical protein [Bacillota bacterium]